MPKPDEAHGTKRAIEDVRAHLRTGPRNIHHRLPRSRGGDNSPENLVEINQVLHAHWHEIFRNKTSREIAIQLTVWMAWGYIFKGEKRLRFVCKETEQEESTGGWFRLRPWSGHGRGGNLRNIHSKMTGDQRDAWNTLFGARTTPDVVVQAINEMLVHPHLPIHPVRPRRWWSSR
ncbi:MAG: hypothetical protein AAB421_01360 [Patescibacteria group bacterium]